MHVLPHVEFEVDERLAQQTTPCRVEVARVVAYNTVISEQSEVKAMKDYTHCSSGLCLAAALAVCLIVLPVTASGQGKGKGKGGGQSLSAPSGRGAGELPSGLERYENKRGDELPRGFEKYEEKRGALPKGLETGGKKSAKEDKQTKKKGKAKKTNKGDKRKTEKSTTKKSQ